MQTTMIGLRTNRTSAMIDARGAYIRQFQIAGRDILYSDPNNPRFASHPSGPFFRDRGALHDKTMKVSIGYNKDFIHLSAQKDSTPDTDKHFPDQCTVASTYVLYDQAIEHESHLYNLSNESHKINMGISLYLPFERGLKITGTDPRNCLNVTSNQLERLYWDFGPDSHAFSVIYPSGYSLSVYSYYKYDHAYQRSKSPCLFPQSLEVNNYQDYIHIKQASFNTFSSILSPIELQPFEKALFHTSMLVRQI